MTNNEHKQSENYFKVIFYALAVIAVFMLLVVYYYPLTRFAHGDFQGHVRFLELFLEAGKRPLFPTYPLPQGYPFLLWVFSGFSSTFDNLLDVSGYVISMLVVFRVLVISRIIPVMSGTSLPWYSSLLVGLALSLVAPVYMIDNFFYIGRLAPNIWHNPTFIAMIPFSILLFWKTPAFVRNPRSFYLVILALGFINLWFKPSFLFAWIPATFFYVLISSFKNRQIILMVTGTLVITGLLILVQYYFVYVDSLYDQLVAEGARSDVGFKFLRVWSHFLEVSQTSLMKALVVSLLFPAMFLVFFARSGEMDEYVKLALLITLFGMVFALLFVETGWRMYDGNFFWTAHASIMMLFLATFSAFLRIQAKRGYRSARVIILWVLFSLHLISGVFQIINYHMTGEYF